MKVVILLAAVIACSLAAPQPAATYASSNDVNYYFYCRRNPNGILVHIDEITTAENLSSVFDPSLETVVLFHGWKDDYGAESNTEVRTALLENFDVNVIKGDWGPLAGKNYISAKNSVPSVGRYAAEMLRKINQLFDYPFDRVTVIGFSLGAHVSGNLGAALNGAVGRIIGLDPAGPLISYRDTDYSLDASDAKFVQVIHTNTAFLGMSEAIGHSDYYPNGGSTQPGCGLILTNACSHNRAWALLVESFTSNRFVAQQCKRYRDYTRGRCDGPKSVMGGFSSLDQSASGSYYLTTNRASPFALG